MSIDPLAEHWLCSKCAYDLHGLAGDPICCPECGRYVWREALRSRIAPPPLPPRNSLRAEIAAHAVSIAAGPAGWMAVGLCTGQPPCETTAYFAAVAVWSLAALLLGYFAPARSWRWPAFIAAGHLLFFSGFGCICGPAFSLILLGLLGMMSLFGASLSLFPRRTN